MDYQHISTRVDGLAGIVSLSRPRELNALNRIMVAEIGDACNQMASDPGIRSIIITGDPHFAAGADISHMMTMNPEEAESFSFRHVFAAIANTPKPVIAAMRGYALGGGLELALACDFRIAAPDASFGLPEIKLGIFPGAGGTIRLPRLIGPARAKMMIYTGQTIGSEQALRYGLIDEIGIDPLESAMALAATLAERPPVALKMAKKCIDSALDLDAAQAIEIEALAWQHCFSTTDQREGMQAFRDKRRPEFHGC